jgi:hypothetical protein
MIKVKSKSVWDINEEAKDKYNTRNNKFSDFPIGTKVKVICAGQDMHFFYGETGVIIKNSGQYLGIIVQFDKPRYFKNGAKQESFNFAPDDLIKMDYCPYCGR